MHSVERLTGDNQYHCSVCGSKQDAERTTFLREVPPYLNLCLMRFTYEKNRRVKSKAAIRYKKELKVGDQRYKLCAVVVHVGTSVSRQLSAEDEH
jgi:ubiquitin C-terminal hydrolase